MHVRVTLISAARGTSLLTERFDDDRPLDETGWHEVRRAAPALLPLGPVLWIMPGSRGLARTLAALSSIADAPRRLNPPPCDRTHQTPLPDPA